jgi:outer membrane protein assembly factor BamD (BamD/ComL family)
MKIELDTWICLPLLCVACAAPQAGPPEDLAHAIIADIDAGRSEEAAERFGAVDDEESYRERIYPIVWDAAQERYTAGDAAGAAGLLRFLVNGYPSATAARQAFLYCLFIERAAQPKPEPELVDEIGSQLEALREKTATPPTWAELVATQHAIDKGRLAEARSSFDRFLAAWPGEPQELLVYVEDIDRYLSSH